MNHSGDRAQSIHLMLLFTSTENLIQKPTCVKLEKYDNVQISGAYQKCQLLGQFFLFFWQNTILGRRQKSLMPNNFNSQGPSCNEAENVSSLHQTTL